MYKTKLFIVECKRDYDLHCFFALHHGLVINAGRARTHARKSSLKVVVMFDR
jgi:hypothetical protein